MKIPKYEIVKKEILSYIEKMPKEQIYLPYESEMEKMYNVSKRTIRRALLDLRNDCLIDTGKKRGSKVIRQSSQTTRAASSARENFLEGKTIASIVVSDKPGDQRTGYLPWRITEELEKMTSEAGGKVLAINAREERWDDFDDIFNALIENKVEFLFCCIHIGFSSKIDFDRLKNSKIKLVFYMESIIHFNHFAYFVDDGVDWIAHNCLGGIYKSLGQDFEALDYIAYIGAEFDYGWEKIRIQTIKKFASQNNIHFEEVIISELEGTELPQYSELIMTPDLRADCAESALLKIIPKVKKAKNPLLIGANDLYAVGIIKALDCNNIKYPSQVQVIGYDNSSEAMRYGISSFNPDEKTIAIKAFEFCKAFYADKEASLANASAITILPKLFKRASTR